MDRKGLVWKQLDWKGLNGKDLNLHGLNWKPSKCSRYNQFKNYCIRKDWVVYRLD